METKLSPIEDNDKNNSVNIKRIEKIMELQSDVITTQQHQLMNTHNSTVSPMSSFHTSEALSRKVEEKPVTSFVDINKKITPLSPVSDNVQNATRNDSASLNGRSKTGGHHEEPFSPDGFTQFEKVLV